MAVSLGKEQALVNASEEVTSIEDSSSRMSLPIYFDRSSGLSVREPVHEMHVGVFFMRKQNGCSSFLPYIYHSKD